MENMTDEVNQVCTVHGNTEVCVASQISRLKIAIAFVLIRIKPDNQSVKDFITNLKSIHEDKENRWKAEYYRLKREMLQVRQHEVLLALKGSSGGELALSGRGGTPGNGHQVASVLTPPCTQKEEASGAHCRTATASARSDDPVAFLRAYFYLEHRLRCRPTDPLNEDVLRQSVFSVLRQAERSAAADRSDFPRCLESLRMCVSLLDSHCDRISGLADRFSATCSNWLQSISAGRNGAKYFALLQILAGCNFAPLLVDLVVKKIVTTQQSLKEWHFDGTVVPRPIFKDFMNSSHFFLLLEKMIPRLNLSDPSLAQRHVAALSDVHPNVQLHFPLFAASMMRCASQLENQLL